MGRRIVIGEESDCEHCDGFANVCERERDGVRDWLFRTRKESEGMRMWDGLRVVTKRIGEKKLFELEKSEEGRRYSY